MLDEEVYAHSSQTNFFSCVYTTLITHRQHSKSIPQDYIEMVGHCMMASGSGCMHIDNERKCGQKTAQSYTNYPACMHPWRLDIKEKLECAERSCMGTLYSA